LISIELSPQEALIVSLSLRESPPGQRWLLLRLAQASLSSHPTTFLLNQDELWLIRSSIDPSKKIGAATGLDVLLKVYCALLEANLWHVPPSGTIKLEEVSHACQDDAQHNPDHDSNDRPRSEAEPRHPVPRPEKKGGQDDRG
jgi:hypothetical protein